MKNNSIIAVDILPSYDGKVVMYGAPNKDIKHLVSGKLRIILSRPLKIKFISIKLKGRSEYSDWEEQYSCLEVIKLEKILYEKDTLPIGVTDFEYEFEVPGNLPQTYRTNFGFIFYKLVAVVQPSSLMSKFARVEKGISFLRHYLPCRRELLPAPPAKVYKGHRKDILDFELDLPTVIGINEKSLLIRLRLLSHNDKGRLKKILFELVQSEKYHVKPSRKDLDEYSIDPDQLIGIVPLNGSSLTKRKRTYPINPTMLNVNNDADNWNNQLIFNLPFAQYSSGISRKPRLKATLKSPLMKVRHKFRFVLMFEDNNEVDMELEIPINVTTIPEEKNPTLIEMFEDNKLPSYDDTFIVNPSINHSERISERLSDNLSENITNIPLNVEKVCASNDPISLSDKQQPKLKQKKSQSLLKRILLRNENKSLNDDSTSEIPLISESRFGESSTSSTTSSSTSTTSSSTSTTSSSSTSSNTNYYLNMPDDDDLDAGAVFEIRSEPCSPKLSGIPSSFSSLNDLSLGDSFSDSLGGELLNLTGVNNNNNNNNNNNIDLSLSNVLRSKSIGSKTLPKTHKRSTSLSSSFIVAESSNSVGPSIQYHRPNIKQKASRPKLSDISENNNKQIHDNTHDKLHHNNSLITGFDLNSINVQIPSPTLKIEHNLEEISIN